jgi:hypothetical protein
MLGRGIEQVLWPLMGMSTLLALVLGVPSLLVGGWDALRGSRSGRPIAFAGPLLLFVGVMTISHPPLSDFVCERGPALCQETFDWADQQVRVRVSTQVHLLYHAVYPTLPFAVLYGLALRRWHPSIVVSARHA